MEGEYLGMSNYTIVYHGVEETVRITDGTLVLEKYLIPRRMLLSALEYLNAQLSTIDVTLFDNTFTGISRAIEVLDNAARKIYNDEIYDERQFKLKKRKQYANIK